MTTIGYHNLVMSAFLVRSFTKASTSVSFSQSFYTLTPLERTPMHINVAKPSSSTRTHAMRFLRHGL